MFIMYLGLIDYIRSKLPNHTFLFWLNGIFLNLRLHNGIIKYPYFHIISSGDVKSFIIL
jgi:hypothetical protein